MNDPRRTTRSHVLAATHVINRDLARKCDDGQLFDLGWNGDATVDQTPWVAGLHNEDVWVLVRRMNKEVFEIQRTKRYTDKDLDLSVSNDLQCSPNRLRSEIERLYMGVIIGSLSLGKTITRIRSWHEPRRTGLFCIVYFMAWHLDCLLCVLICISMALITSPRVRRFFFPPAPLSMINTMDGCVAKPMAGILGSTDTATGAPQNLRGESIENEASNFVTSFAAVVANLITGADPHGAPYDATAGSHGGVIPHVNAGTAAAAKDKAEGMDRPSEDKTKKPMEDAIWSHTTPMLHKIIAVSNLWERLANILVPTSPFRHEQHQLRLAILLSPLALASLVITRDLAVRTFTFAFGVGIFGGPLLSWFQEFLAGQDLIIGDMNLKDPLKGAPTNQQLALTLLRLGEANKAPIPPPIGVHKEPLDEAIDLDETVLGSSLGDDPLGLPEEDLQDLANRDKGMTDDAGGADNEMQQAAGPDQKREKIFNILKDGARGAVKIVVAADKLRGKAGAPHAKLRAGVLPASSDQPQKLGPVLFSARYDGRKGYVYVDSMAEEPYVAFHKRHSGQKADKALEDDEAAAQRILWKVKIDDIVRLKKHSGYGLKTKLGAGWAVNGGVQDGLRIVDKEENEWVVTALPHRDALFNRLCAISRLTQWEIC